MWLFAILASGMMAIDKKWPIDLRNYILLFAKTEEIDINISSVYFMFTVSI